MSARSIIRSHRRQQQRRSRAGKVAAGAAAVAGAAALTAPGADAATFQVTNLNDAGAGSLRQAVLDANLAADADTVTFASGLSGQIKLTSGVIPIDAAVTIQGPGSGVLSVSGEDASQIFDVEPDTVGAQRDPVTITGLTLTKGKAASDGGAMYVGYANLKLDDVTITDSYAGSNGGAIDLYASPVLITNSRMTGNSSNSEAGFMYTDGVNAEDNDQDTVTIRNTVVADNSTSGDGGAMYMDNATGGDILIEGSTFRNNHASGVGGALYFYGSKGLATVRSSTISGNTADTGGGIHFNSDYDIDGLRVEDSTITGNAAASEGGGIFVENDNNEPVLIRDSTVAGNAAVGQGGGIFRKNFPVGISSTIVADNVAASQIDLGQDAAATGQFDVGNSLVENGTSGVTIAQNPAGTNKLGIDPQLGPLADNGGPTLTQLPALTSPAVDAGVANGLATDQRGLKRTVELSSVPNSPGSDGTDIGAVEIQDTSLDGAKLEAPKKQKVKKKVVVKVKASAAEPVDVLASGKVKAGKKSYGLKKASAALESGTPKKLKLKPKSKKATKKIVKFLQGGKKAKASISVSFTDASGNSVTEKAKVKLIAKKKK